MHLKLRCTIILIGPLFFLLVGCIYGGTHGSIKAYQYPISKYDLDSAAQKVVASNPNIMADTLMDYYNDIHTYVTMEIKQADKTYRYTFRYSGDSAVWDTSPNLSGLFIAYAWDEDGVGGSEGNGLRWYNWRLKRKLIKPFETEFISKVDSLLKMKHTIPE